MQLLDFIIKSLTITAAAAFVFMFLVAQIRNKGESYDDNTVSRLKQAYDALEIENKELRRQLTELQTAVKGLQESNLVLQNVVTGKDVLSSIQGDLKEFEKVINKKLDTLLERRHQERRDEKGQ